MEELAQIVGPAAVLQASEAPCILNRAQERIVVVRDVRGEPGRCLLGDDQSRYLAASTVVAAPFVPGDEEDAVALAPGWGVENVRAEPSLEPGIAGRNRAVVHVVAQVGHDQF